jgi:hypothetical protein
MAQAGIYLAQKCLLAARTVPATATRRGSICHGANQRLTSTTDHHGAACYTNITDPTTLDGTSRMLPQLHRSSDVGSLRVSGTTTSDDR